jgi:hypothetical protein
MMGTNMRANNPNLDDAREFSRDDPRRALDIENRYIDRDEWLHSFGPHVRADTLARLGRLDEALADAALLPEDHWMPAHDGLPGGDKRQFIAEIRRRAAARNGRP